MKSMGRDHKGTSVVCMVCMYERSKCTHSFSYTYIARNLLLAAFKLILMADGSEGDRRACPPISGSLMLIALP